MIAPTLLLTHPGGAHKDEFLACCVLLARHTIPIERREPTEADLASPEVCVIDAGHRHEPALNNFDHHQFPREHAPTCALSLVLQHLGLYEDAREFCDWLETAEWFDCRGPIDTARWLGMERATLGKLISPIDITILRRFAGCARLNPGHPIWEIMRMVGEDMIGHVTSSRAKLDQLQRVALRWELDIGGAPGVIVFLARTDTYADDIATSLDRYIERQSWAGQVVGSVYPDRRAQGYGLGRYRDNPRLDFTRIAREPDVHFAHARGFVAKTSANDIARLQALIVAAGHG
jgi:Uncharacterised protein family (UPF0160)